MRTSLKAIFAAITLTALQVAASDFTVTTTPAPEWNSLFQQTNGWAGADVAYSVPLAKDKTFWLFGDTFVGQVSGGKRVNCRMIHSSIAIQQLGEAPRFFYPIDAQDHAQSFMKSPDGKTDFWLMDGARNDHGLYFLMLQMEWTSGGAWGFRTVGDWLASVENPDASPARWKISTKKLPFFTLANGEMASFGSATLQSGGYVYIYGYSNPKASSNPKSLILARVPENQMDDLNSWEFYSAGAWSKDFQKMTPLFSDAPPEGSVSWQPYLKKFVFIYMDGIWGTIVMRTADAPQGPWSPTTKIYHCPEMKISPKVFCYAAKGHPELSATNELLISYASNSENFSELNNDARIYWPKFIRVTFQNH
jgi:hypothetical protein